VPSLSLGLRILFIKKGRYGIGTGGVLRELYYILFEVLDPIYIKKY
jgi:hypothetical protein